MLYAITESKDKIQATKETRRALCPSCNQVMIAKTGDINVWHWAHESLTECDPWREGESAWHLSWKSLFPKEWVEIQIVKGKNRHIADILTSQGKIIEFQKSPISVGQIEERENFYGNLIWVFDVRDAYIEDRLSIEESVYSHYFRWKYAKKSILLATKPKFLDTGNGELFRIKTIKSTSPCYGFGNLDNQESFVARFTRGSVNFLY